MKSYTELDLSNFLISGRTRYTLYSQEDDLLHFELGVADALFNKKDILVTLCIAAIRFGFQDCVSDSEFYIRDATNGLFISKKLNDCMMNHFDEEAYRAIDNAIFGNCGVVDLILNQEHGAFGLILNGLRKALLLDPWGEDEIVVYCECFLKRHWYLIKQRTIDVRKIVF